MTLPGGDHVRVASAVVEVNRVMMGLQIMMPFVRVPSARPISFPGHPLIPLRL